MREVNVVQVEATEGAGATVWWDLMGELEVAALSQAWADAGLDPSLFPNAPSDEVAVRRAAAELGGRSVLVRRLPDRSGYCVVLERDTGNNALEWVEDLRVQLRGDGSCTVEPQGHPEAQRLRDLYTRAHGYYNARDLGAFLGDLTERLSGVALRQHGGLYFVPPSSLAEWRRYAETIEKVSTHRISIIPALRSEDAVKAILGALTIEADVAVAKIEEELNEGDIGKRAIEGRVERTYAMRSKVEHYEQLLGVSLDTLREKLDALRAMLAAAALAQDGEA